MRSMYCTHTLARAVGRIGSRPVLRPYDTAALTSWATLAHFLARISGHRHFPFPPHPSIPPSVRPQPYLSSPPPPSLPWPSKAAASHEPFFCVKRSPFCPLCVLFRQRDWGPGGGGLFLLKGDTGDFRGWSFWARPVAPDPQGRLSRRSDDNTLPAKLPCAHHLPERVPWEA